MIKANLNELCVESNLVLVVAEDTIKGRHKKAHLTNDRFYWPRTELPNLFGSRYNCLIKEHFGGTPELCLRNWCQVRYLVAVLELLQGVSRYPNWEPLTQS